MPPGRRMRVEHQVPITSPDVFSSPYPEIPIDKNDPRGREPLVPLESVGVGFESYYAETDCKNSPYGRSIEGSQPDVGQALRNYFEISGDNFADLYKVRTSGLQNVFFSANGIRTTRDFEKDLDRYRKRKRPVCLAFESLKEAEVPGHGSEIAPVDLPAPKKRFAG